MKKILCLVIIILNIVSAFSMKFDMFETYDNNSNKEYMISDNNTIDYFHLYYEQEVYKIDSIIDLEASLYLTNNMLYYDFQCDGFDIVSDVVYDKTKIAYSIKLSTCCEYNPSIMLKVFLDNGDYLDIGLYGYVADDDIYISRFSFENAENIYLSYLEINDIDKYNQIRSEMMPCNDPIILDELQTISELQSSGPANTYVEGTLSWRGLNNNVHPIQFSRVQLWDKQPNGERLLDITYTDEAGHYIFGFVNADNISDNENGGYDVFIRVLPAGINSTVYMTNRVDYKDDIGYYENIPTGTIHYVSKEYSNNIGDIAFYKAIQISQAVIFASKYVEAMNNDNISNVSIIYPYNDNSNCFYSHYNRTICISEYGASNQNQNNGNTIYWDVVMHEYGHHVENEFNIIDNPGGTHWINAKMGDHYRSHYDEENLPCTCSWDYFVFSQCKNKGNGLAWSEGWATYFGMVAQEYFSSNLSGIEYVADGKYTDIGEYNLSDGYRLGEDCEGTIMSILYDMYDNSVDDSQRDNLFLGHQTMWDLSINSQAKTFNDFDKYVREYVNPSYLSNYGKILNYYKLASSKVVTSQLSSFSPTFFWSENSCGSRYFNNIKYDLNFYDSNRTFIDKTSQTQYTNITISDSLWSRVINSGTMFYVSVTKYEESSPITYYEGEWECFQVPVTKMYYSTNITRELNEGECHWFVFTAPQSAYFSFETTGSMDTYGELFSSILVGQSSSNRLAYDDDSGNNSNFCISYYLERGGKIYLRVRGYAWANEGEFTVRVYSPNHSHIYDYEYISLDDVYHISRCCCGAYTQDYHHYISIGAGQRCNKCYHFTTGPIITPFPTRFNNNNMIEENYILE